MLQLVDVLHQARTIPLQPSRKWHMEAVLTMVPLTSLLYYRGHPYLIFYSSSRACLWKVLQPDFVESSDCNTSILSIRCKTHCCKGHRPLPTIKERLLLWHNYKTKLVSPCIRQAMDSGSIFYTK